MAKIVTCDWPESDPITYLDHYEVWRKTGSGGTYAKISGDIAQGTLTYVDSSTLVDSTQYFYEVRAYNATGDYNALEDSITISGGGIGLLVSQPFTGVGTINSSEWTVTNDDPTMVSFERNNGLDVQVSEGTPTGVNNILSTTLISSLDFCASWDIRTFQEDASSGLCGLWKDGNEQIAGIRWDAGGTIEVQCKNNNVLAGVDQVLWSLAQNGFGSVQIVGDGTNVNYYVWITDAWSLIATYTFNTAADLYWKSIATPDSGAPNCTNFMKNLCIGTASQRWTTQYPSGVTPL